MEDEYRKKINISYTNVDKNLELGLENLISIIQDAMTEYFRKIGSDNVTIKEENDAAWVIRKMSFHIEKWPKWLDYIELTSYISEKTKIRLDVETKAMDENNNFLFAGKQEVCPIDLKTRKIRKIDTIKYPQDIKIRQTIMENSFERLDEKFTSNNKICNVKVHSRDIDFTNHTNNVNYVRYLMNTFNSDFLNMNKITDVEIHYLHESVEGDLLELYRKASDDNMNFLIKKGEEEIVRARFKFVST